MFSVTLLKTKIRIINLNKSSTSHFTKVSLHDFTDLRVKLAFYGGTKEHYIGLSKKVEFRIFVEFKIKIHIRMQNAAFKF